MYQLAYFQQVMLKRNETKFFETQSKYTDFKKSINIRNFKTVLTKKSVYLYV